MKSVNFSRLIPIIAFIGLAGFSCFWTAESLFIWQPSITKIGAWFIAIAFYLIASLCFAKMVKALDRYEYFDGKILGRGATFFLCLVGFLVFWAFSLATNAHTLLYRASIENTIKIDLERTQSYLRGLKDNNIEIKEINKKYEALEKSVDAILQRMLAEIEHPALEGIGPRFKTTLAELETVLSTKLQPVENPGTNKTQWLTTLGHYQKQAYDVLAIKKKYFDKEIERIQRTMKSTELANLITNCDIAKAAIDSAGIDNRVIGAVINELDNGYAFIKANANYIHFTGNDQERYTREGAIPEGKELLSIPDVWKDYLTTDKFKGHGFIWWILLSVLVDLSAFILFNISVNKKFSSI